MIGTPGIGRPRSVLLAVIGCVVLSCPAAAQTPEELFDTGNLAYEQGRYQEAAVAYRAAARYGIEDVRLDYNLGNAEFKLGNLGQAILHYERAYRLSPTDPDIVANLELARSMRFDRVEPAEVAAPVRWIKAVQDRLGPDRQAAAVLAGVWLIALLVAWAFYRPGRWHPMVGWALAAMLVVTLAVGASWWTTYERLERRDRGIVLEETVEVLAGPGDNNAPLVTVHEGLSVRIRSERDDWIQVSLPNGLNGWVPRSAVGVV